MINVSPIRLRLLEFLRLQAGWLDGDGVAYESKLLEWLIDMFAAYYPGDLPAPRLYPMLEGGISLEWGLFSHPLQAVVCELNLQTKRIETTVADLNKGADSFTFDLSTVVGWGDLVRVIRTTKGLT